jgi:uncharacterized protein (DUF302 family)
VVVEGILGEAMAYGFTKTVQLSYDEAVKRVTLELQKEGFGVLTTIDVKETLKKKLGVDFKRYVILGACNPPFAHRVLQAEENIGLLLPCNVVVYERGNEVVVGAFNPMAMMTLVDNPGVEAIAREVKSRLERVIAAV